MNRDKEIEILESRYADDLCKAEIIEQIFRDIRKLRDSEKELEELEKEDNMKKKKPKCKTKSKRKKWVKNMYQMSIVFKPT